MKNAQKKAATGATRIERDTMGELAVPANAYYGVQTARAIENFPISPLRLPRSIIRAMGMIKRAAASVNHSLELLDKKPADAIKQAATEVMDGKLDAEFPVDIFQTGSGTSTNMNTNEVISNRATELLGGDPWQQTCASERSRESRPIQQRCHSDRDSHCRVGNHRSSN